MRVLWRVGLVTGGLLLTLSGPAVAVGVEVAVPRCVVLPDLPGGHAATPAAQGTVVVRVPRLLCTADPVQTADGTHLGGGAESGAGRLPFTGFRLEHLLGGGLLAAVMGAGVLWPARSGAQRRAR